MAKEPKLHEAQLMNESPADIAIARLLPPKEEAVVQEGAVEGEEEEQEMLQLLLLLHLLLQGRWGLLAE